MTPAEAEQIQPKSLICAPDTVPAWRPYKVIDVWVNETKTLARFRVQGLKGWTDASRWKKAPPGSTVPAARRR